MTYKLYYSPGSANLVVRMVLEELGLAYTDVLVPRTRIERDSDFLRLNPRGLVPVLVDAHNDITISETAAIILFLADTSRRLVPDVTAPRERAECLKWLFLLSNTLHADLNMRFYPDQYFGDHRSKTFDENTDQRIFAHFSMLDQSVGQHASPTFLKSGISVCDFYLGCLLRWAQLYPAGESILKQDELRKFPHLTKVFGEIQERLAVRRALLAEGYSGGPAFINPARKPAVT